MRKPKDSYVCPRCGHVLPKEDAVVSGWDAEGSSTHVHCPRCEKIIAMGVVVFLIYGDIEATRKLLRRTYETET